VAEQLDVEVLSTTPMKAVFEELSPLFEHATGNRLVVDLGPSAQLEQRLDDGEVADVAILTTAAANGLIERGRVVPGSLVDVARSFLGVAVRKGLPKPDISTVDAFKHAMLAAKSIAVSKPAGGGLSGVHMAKVFAQLGIAEAMNAKAKYGTGGPTGLVGLFLQRGEAEIGIQQIAELMAVSGIDMVGPLPAPLQSLTPLTACIPTSATHPDAGRAVIDFLITAAAKSVIRARGLEPA